MLKNIGVMIFAITATAVTAWGGLAAVAPLRDTDDPPGGPAQYYRAYGENCYLVFSSGGMLGCYLFQDDYGFHYNLGSYFPPERYAGLYSWADAPSLVSYNNFVETATATNQWIQLPADATTLTLEYYAKWNVETDFDGVELEIARQGEPSNWINLHPTSATRGSGRMGQPSTTRFYYDGEQLTWKKERVDISAYKGNGVKLRFHFRSDTSNNGCYFGLYFDEVKIVKDGGSNVYYNGFENGTTDNWTNTVYGGHDEDKWGISQALPAECNFLSSGNFIVGASSSYVAEAFTPDWKSSSAGWPTLVNYANSTTRQPSDPEFRITEFVYPYRDFVIIDCYVKNGQPGTQNNIYAGTILDIDILHNAYERTDDERVTYKSAGEYAMFYDDGGSDESLCAVKVFKTGSPAAGPSSVNFLSFVDWMGDNTLYAMLSNGEFDYRNVVSPVGRWAVAIGKGPFSLTQSETFRYSFAIVGADNDADMAINIGLAEKAFTQVPDKTPINVEPGSLGRIKAIFK